MLLVIQMELPKRKNMRLKNYDYNSPGAYFITICTENRKNILSKIVGTGVLDGPQNVLTDYGKIADKCIDQLNNYYDYLNVDKYVIMPNHIHILLQIKYEKIGPSGTPVPTNEKQNSAVSQFVSTFKRFSNKEYGKNIWQRRSYDHVVRNDKDYKEIWEYIENNPINWNTDDLYC